MKLFSPLHIGFLVFTVAVIAWAVLARRQSWESNRRLRFAVAATLVIFEIAWTAVCTFVLDVPFVDNIPIHLCDWGLMALVWHLVFPSRASRNILPYVGIPGATLALLLPHITEPYPYMIFSVMRFFIAHTAIVAGGLRATLNRGYVPSWNATVRAYLAFVVLTVPIGLVNLWLDKNYCYSFEPPQTADFLDGIPIWAYRIGFYPTIFLFFAGTRVLLERAISLSQLERLK